VEDRTTPALYLELVDIDRDSYFAQRSRSVLQRPSVCRLTCWENQAPNRTDLPRRLDEFGWLAVYEVDAAFEAPACPEGVRGLHFTRTARPGQGRLSERDTLGLVLVLISPRQPDEAAALRSWADFVHIRHIAAAAVPGYTMITPYESRVGDTPRFLHFYEMDTPDAEPTFASMTQLVAERLGGVDSDSFRNWANHESLRIDYVSTFTRIGPPVEATHP
jgi:hypothetical protein